MNQPLLILLLSCCLSGLLGALLMWQHLRRKLDLARAQYAGMREAFQAQHTDKQKMFEAQQRIWEAYKELLNYKLSQP